MNPYPIYEYKISRFRTFRLLVNSSFNEPTAQLPLILSRWLWLLVLFIYANNKRKWTFRTLKPLTLDAALLIIFGWTLIWRDISCAPVRRGKIVLSSSMWSLYTQISDTLSNSNVFIHWGSRKVISCWFDNIFANISNLVFFSLLLFCIVCLHIIFFNWKIYLHLMFCLKI